jgi:hypothetical protein
MRSSVGDISIKSLVVSGTTLPWTGAGSLFTKRLVVRAGVLLSVERRWRVTSISVVTSGRRMERRSGRIHVEYAGA